MQHGTNQLVVSYKTEHPEILLLGIYPEDLYNPAILLLDICPK